MVLARIYCTDAQAVALAGHCSVVVVVVRGCCWRLLLLLAVVVVGSCCFLFPLVVNGEQSTKHQTTGVDNNLDPYFYRAANPKPQRWSVRSCFVRAVYL